MNPHRTTTRSFLSDCWRPFSFGILLLLVIYLVWPSSDKISGKPGSTTPSLQSAASTMKFTLSSSAFDNGGVIPSKYCDGSTISPPVFWTTVPNAKSYVMIVDDPDAPDPKHPRPQGPWVHWVLYNIPPTTSSLEEGQSPLPTGTLVGLNDWARLQFDGPSPPIGEHRYFFKLYALDALLPDLGSTARKDTVLEALKSHAIDHTTLVGVYGKKKRH